MDYIADANPGASPSDVPNADLIAAAKAGIAAAKLKEFLELYASKTERDAIADPEVIDLSAGFDQYKPYRVLMPFRSFWVLDATDANVNAKISFHTREAHSVQTGIPIKKNFLWNIDTLIQEAWITAPAQPGKTMTILFLKKGRIDPGFFISQNAGGISVNEGLSVTTRSNAALNLAAGAATLALPADTTRNCETIQNFEGVTLYAGDANVTGPTGTNPGIALPPNGVLVWKNTGALYLFNPSVSALNPAKIARNFEA
jgi:hypothetical protein